MSERNGVMRCVKDKKRELRIELGYLRSPPALSAGPHMENQVSGPLGTDVCSPLDSSQSATEAVKEPGPLTTPYSHKSFTPGTEGENFGHRAKHKQAKRQEKALSHSC
ncbi:hypothetical protein EYF80_030509 [Xyrichtys novacula]|uniref:Uncharacterized protein n=1 Tax=Xyrichtys novacula TaxID=13765 RepID=A0AAV1H4B9_XYRNO|nr:hypothetical protein EYF80_030509 [Xyrichtys novacula]